ncbi:hypothetical protein V2E24_02435 [Mycoplasmopsis ciconiae]|uniref:Lipoprotein n=1 Tax=Mycoplasmopsis ciconiae TaxID=561067 RepID=A0ABU7MLL7_9BACT|nr:hypothetical protein [Mycoplasmopsis ciconiae]
MLNLKKIFLLSSSLVSLIPVSFVVACDSSQEKKALINIRNQVQQMNDEELLKLLDIKYPPQSLSNLEAEPKNYTSEALWSINAFRYENQVTFDGYKFNIFLENVVGNPGSDITTFTFKVQLNSSLVTDPIYARRTTSLFKAIRLNHNHYSKQKPISESIKKQFSDEQILENLKKYN